MTDLGKAQAIQARFSEGIDNGFSKEESSRQAIKGHLNGFVNAEYGGYVLAYCGDYLVLFEGRGIIYREI